MNYKRTIEEKLKAWSQSSFRKPLVLRGARQVGKTTAVKLFARNFHQFVFLNLETEDAKMFESATFVVLGKGEKRFQCRS
ncbi:AAA family ATPase [Bacteroides fluxus]|uniref:AAA family ATPase n=1 Tax=Bacteroides fluxus TaxID=626930 RepID=UPI002A81F468|nr:AAA family ATPase [Bacteroides fluxus]MDY3790661.1 AAA family ATPase [Bacteroides fluxus]